MRFLWGCLLKLGVFGGLLILVGCLLFFYIWDKVGGFKLEDQTFWWLVAGSLFLWSILKRDT